MALVVHGGGIEVPLQMDSDGVLSFRRRNGVLHFGT